MPDEEAAGDDEAYVEKRVTIRIDKRTKDEWFDYLNETTTWMTMTHLVKDAVNEAIARDKDDHPGEPVDPTATVAADVNLDGVEHELEDIKETLSSMHSDLELVRSNTAYALDSPNFISDIYQMIPTVETEHEMHQLLAEADLSQFDEPDMARVYEYGAIVDIHANFAAYSEQLIEDAIDALLSKFDGEIRQITRDGYQFMFEVEVADE